MTLLVKYLILSIVQLCEPEKSDSYSCSNVVPKLTYQMSLYCSSARNHHLDLTKYRGVNQV